MGSESEKFAHESEREAGLAEFPAPQAAHPGWYPDPLGSTAERYWDGTWKDLTRESQLRLQMAGRENGSHGSRAGGLLSPLRRVPKLVPALGRAAREERAREREQQKRSMAIEAERQAFFRTPAGRARLSYERGHRLFQLELPVNNLTPMVIPGPVGSPAQETTDAVEVLNSVVVEGWKLVNAKFIYVEMRNGVVGCYLFKRSPKRHRAMNEPWQDLA